MDSIGFFVMTAMLGAGAAYAMANKGKPRPTLSKGKRNVVIACFGIAVVCLLVVLAGGMLPHGAPSH